MESIAQHSSFSLIRRHPFPYGKAFFVVGVTRFDLRLLGSRTKRATELPTHRGLDIITFFNYLHQYFYYSIMSVMSTSWSLLLVLTSLFKRFVIGFLNTTTSPINIARMPITNIVCPVVHVRTPFPKSDEDRVEGILATATRNKKYSEWKVLLSLRHSTKDHQADQNRQRLKGRI